MGMTQSYKVCPQCGQPAVPEMPQCRRCGFLYVAPPFSGAEMPAPVLPPTAASTPYRVELSHAQRADLRARRRAGMLTTLAGVLLLALLGVGIYRLTRTEPPDKGLLTQGEDLLPRRQDLTNAPARPYRAPGPPLT